MSRTGKFKDHIEHAVVEAKKQCSWILRTFHTRESTLMLTLWKSLVQSRLEYCSQLWCPLQTGDIQTVEMVQRSFIRKISGCQHLNYWEQLKYFKLFSLERRRERYRIIYTRKILNGIKFLAHFVADKIVFWFFTAIMKSYLLNYQAFNEE